jgi:preprotein translocase subunit SecG
MQRSEGGALGIGGGGGGGFMSGRGSANLLTRATGILAAAFFATSIILSILGRQGAPTSILGSPPASSSQPSGGEAGGGAGEGGGILPKLQPLVPAEPSAPQSQ